MQGHQLGAISRSDRNKQSAHQKLGGQAVAGGKGSWFLCHRLRCTDGSLGNAGQGKGRPGQRQEHYGLIRTDLGAKQSNSEKDLSQKWPQTTNPSHKFNGMVT